jgi:ABC-2 type transport system ATP-binding protein
MASTREKVVLAGAEPLLAAVREQEIPTDGVLDLLRQLEAEDRLPVAELQQVTYRFGGRTELHNVTLRLKRGEVCVVHGESDTANLVFGILMGRFIRPAKGEVRVFGENPYSEHDPYYRHPVHEGRIGYVCEWMHEVAGGQLWEQLRRAQRYSPRWDEAYAGGLCEQFGLKGDARLDELELEDRMAAEVVVALARRPDLLLLEMSACGRSPSRRREILHEVRAAAKGRGVAVLLHTLDPDEIELIGDNFVVFYHGQIVLAGPGIFPANCLEPVLNSLKREIKDPPFHPNVLVV